MRINLIGQIGNSSPGLPTVAGIRQPFDGGGPAGHSRSSARHVSKRSAHSPQCPRRQNGKAEAPPEPALWPALARHVWSRFRGDVYLDRANILSYDKHPGLNPQGQLRITEGVDIVANDVTVRPESGAHRARLG
jgi:hypothetical protein